MYEISWYLQMAVVLAMLVETFKRSGGHWMRDNILSRFNAIQYYPFVIKGAAFVIALVLCFGAKADALITLEIEGFAPEIGYIIGAILILGGDTLIDAAWDKRKTLGELADAWLKGGTDAPAD